jgi:hypothetical protein
MVVKSNLDPPKRAVIVDWGWPRQKVRAEKPDDIMGYNLLC